MYVGLLMFTLVISNSLINQGVNLVLLAHNYHIIGSFVCRDQNIIGMEFMEGIFDMRLIKTLHLGDLKCSFKFKMRSITISFSWSFHSKRYLRFTCSLLNKFFAKISMDSKIIVSVAFQLTLFGSLDFGSLATSSLNLAFPMTLRSPVITWPCGS